MSPLPPAVGIDFGTTNSSVALVRPGGEVELVRFASAAGPTASYRSLLYMEQSQDDEGRFKILCWTGPEGIERYLAADHKGRLVQSLKSYLTSQSLKSTDVFGRRRTLESLIAEMLRDLRMKAEAQLGVPVRTAVVGRPVHFVGAETAAEDETAETRLRESFRLAGYEDVSFEMEPVAAAFYYESTLDHDELILIGDFGGGTSDFSLVRVGPEVRARGRRPEDLLGNAGVGIAGDDFDAKLIRHLVSPALGDGTEIRSMDKTLTVPTWPYRSLERWHHLSLLKRPDVLTMLTNVRAQAKEPEKIDNFLDLIEEELGYPLHRAVQDVKSALSGADRARFQFACGRVVLDSTVARADFETWIAEELARIEGCVEGLLRTSNVAAADVDRVFLTGGTSFVPAVRRIFESRFGAERIRAGDEFTSVAQGLALSAAHHRMAI
jgi:hypothetical chaperone protein